MEYNSRYFNDTAIVSRNTYVWDKSWYNLTWNSYKGYLKIKKDIITDEIWNEKLAMTYHFNTFFNSDIKIWDILEIDWLKYNVQEIWKKNGLIIKYLFCILDKKD